MASDAALSTPQGGDDQRFVPALGHRLLTPLYDRALRLATRESVWRPAFVDQIAPKAGELILDVGCGTGSLALLLKRKAPAARVIGLDPDPLVLAIARTKAAAAGFDVEWRVGFARNAIEAAGKHQVDKVVSSLVFHQVPVAEKRAGLTAMFEAVRPGGAVHVADYARQPTRLMRALFTTIGRLDGFDKTRPNANGILEDLLSELSASAVPARRIVRTPTGAISLFACSARSSGDAR